MSAIRIPLAKPDIRTEDIAAVVRVLESGMLVQGENVVQLEELAQNFLKVKHAIAVSNGTATMHLALKVLGIGPGDEVIVPAFSFMATANVVELVGAKPVFVDIDLLTFNIDIKKIEAMITQKTKAIIPVHEFGLACEIRPIMALAQKHNLHVIEDAACAFGAQDKNQYVGTFGTFGSFSFHPRKAITSGEGGLLVTNDDSLANLCRVLRNHGTEIKNGKVEFTQAGFNYRMTDFQAALVKSQYQRFDQICARRASLAKVYIEEFGCWEKISLPSVPSGKTHLWQTFHIMVSEKFDRDQVIRQMKELGIGVNYGAQCMPAQNYYQVKYPELKPKQDFSNAYKAYHHGLALPLYELLNEKQIQEVVVSLKRCLHD